MSQVTLSYKHKGLLFSTSTPLITRKVERGFNELYADAPDTVIYIDFDKSSDLLYDNVMNFISRSSLKFTNKEHGDISWLSFSIKKNWLPSSPCFKPNVSIKSDRYIQHIKLKQLELLNESFPQVYHLSLPTSYVDLDVISDAIPLFKHLTNLTLAIPKGHYALDASKIIEILKQVKLTIICEGEIVVSHKSENIIHSFFKEEKDRLALVEYLKSTTLSA